MGRSFVVATVCGEDGEDRLTEDPFGCGRPGKQHDLSTDVHGPIGYPELRKAAAGPNQRSVGIGG